MSNRAPDFVPLGLTRRLTEIRNHDLADWFQERIEIQAGQVVGSLKPGETLVTTVVLANGEEIVVTWVGYHNPNMLVIDGLDGENNRVRLLAAPESVQILFRIHTAKGEEEPPKTVGFQVRTSEESILLDESAR